MRVGALCAAVFAASCLAGSRVHAQLAPPGSSGVVMGHVHVLAQDLDAQRRFWDQLDGTPVQNGRLQLIQFPGVFVMLREGEPAGGTVGSRVNHIGFQVRRMQDWLPRWEAAGLEIETTSRPSQIYLMGPDGVRVEILEDTTLAHDLAFHHVHYYVPRPLEAQAWYQEMFGAVPGKRGNFDAGDLPGVNLTFSQSDDPLAATEGRSLDHVGFEVRGLEALARRLEEAGVTLQRPYQRLADSSLALVYLIDPWGTRLELTENLSP